MTLLASILDSLCLDIQHFRVFFFIFFTVIQVLIYLKKF